MNKRILVLLAGVALVALLAFGVTAAVFAQSAGSNSGRGSYGPGSMMNGGNSAGMMGGNYSATPGATNGNGGNGYGSGGMMNGGNGGGMMNGGMMNGGNGMMGGNYAGTPANTQPLTIDEAKTAATNYLAGLKNSNLAIDEIMIFDNNAYVAIKDNSTGVGAFELLVNPVTKVAFPEYGPNMMWNLLYGHMSGNGSNGMMGGTSGMMGGASGMMSGGGMMGGTSGMMSGGGMMGGTSGMMSGLGAVDSSNYQAGKMPVTADKALQLAQTYLDKAYPGVKVGQKADEFPGYYTIEVELNGKTSGMLSVNGYSGQVWYHTWHGQFLQMQDYGA
ncbi:MAG TPA: hypothetical protein VH186_36680 [Chloroflexia bacterium]|nr:hypothetical protein [Chloroflexia bacterium]